MESPQQYTWPAVTATLLDPVRLPFRAAAKAFIPELADAPPATWERLEATVERTLDDRPAAMRRQLVLFLRCLDLLALLRHGRRLTRLPAAQRTRLLEGLSRASLLPIRRGVWGLRTLVQMGYYTQPEVQAAIGYRASAAGWEARI